MANNEIQPRDDYASSQFVVMPFFENTKYTDIDVDSDHKLSVPVLPVQNPRISKNWINGIASGSVEVDDYGNISFINNLDTELYYTIIPLLKGAGINNTNSPLSSPYYKKTYGPVAKGESITYTNGVDGDYAHTGKYARIDIYVWAKEDNDKVIALGGGTKMNKFVITLTDGTTQEATIYTNEADCPAPRLELTLADGSKGYVALSGNAEKLNFFATSTSGTVLQMRKTYQNNWTVTINQQPNQTIHVWTGENYETDHTATFDAPDGTKYKITVVPDTGYNAGTPILVGGGK